MLAEAVSPAVTVPMESVLAGPAAPGAPSAPGSPLSPLGSTRLSVWFGASPVMVAWAVPPEETVPIESVLAGPAAPVYPCGPCYPSRPQAK